VEKDDIALVNWRDVPAAIGLLTRLPVPVNAAQATARGAKAAWAYPIAGLAVALLLGLIGGLTDGLLPQGWCFAHLPRLRRPVAAQLRSAKLAGRPAIFWGRRSRFPRSRC